MVDMPMLLHTLKIKKATPVGKTPCIIITEQERGDICKFVEECDAMVKAAKGCETKALSELGKMHLIMQESNTLRAEQDRLQTELKSLRGLKKGRNIGVGWSVSRVKEDEWIATNKEGNVIAVGDSLDGLLKNMADAVFEQTYQEAIK